MKQLLLSIAILVSVAAAQAQIRVVQYNEGYYGQPQATRLSPHDQEQFDKYYAKWVDATRKNDQDDIAGNARHLQEIMARYNIPADVPFEQIASDPTPRAYVQPYGYPNSAYPNGYPAYAGRLSPHDQQEFDKHYAKWVDAVRKNDTDDVQGNARHLQEIMARYNIPADTPFQVIATNAYSSAAYPPGPNPAYSYPYGQPQRLSDKDQKNFDKAYKHWVEARRKKHMDDVDSNARKMQDIMARYNIPANIPFDRIASPDAGYR